MQIQILFEMLQSMLISLFIPKSAMGALLVPPGVPVADFSSSVAAAGGASDTVAALAGLANSFGSLTAFSALAGKCGLPSALSDVPGLASATRQAASLLETSSQAQMMRNFFIQTQPDPSWLPERDANSTPSVSNVPAVNNSLSTSQEMRFAETTKFTAPTAVEQGHRNNDPSMAPIAANLSISVDVAAAAEQFGAGAAQLATAASSAAMRSRINDAIASASAIGTSDVSVQPLRGAGGAALADFVAAAGLEGSTVAGVTSRLSG